MILVADSGSTKTDWLLQLNDGEVKQFRTAGLNPYFLSEKEIAKTRFRAPTHQDVARALSISFEDVDVAPARF